MGVDKNPDFWVWTSGALVTLWSTAIYYIGRLFGGRLREMQKEINELKKKAPSGDNVCLSVHEFERNISLIQIGIQDIKRGQGEIHSRIDDLINDVIRHEHTKHNN